MPDLLKVLGRVPPRGVEDDVVAWTAKPRLCQTVVSDATDEASKGAAAAHAYTAGRMQHDLAGQITRLRSLLRNSRGDVAQGNMLKAFVVPGTPTAMSAKAAQLATRTASLTRIGALEAGMSHVSAVAST